jgi:Helix-turn-helix domain
MPVGGHTRSKSKLRQWLLTGKEDVMTLGDAPDFLTMEETAQILRIGRNQVYELARVWRATSGERGLPVVEFGRRLRVPKAVLVRLAGLAGPAGAEHER